MTARKDERPGMVDATGALNLALAGTWNLLGDLARRPDTFLSFVFQAFGNAGSDPDVFQAGAEALRVAIVEGGDLGIVIDLRDDTDLRGARAAYAAHGADGRQQIYVNADCLAHTDTDSAIKVLVEEIGHAFDQRLNAGRDSQGDEGELFAGLVIGHALTDAHRTAIQDEDDSGTLEIHGQRVVGHGQRDQGRRADRDRHRRGRRGRDALRYQWHHGAGHGDGGRIRQLVDRQRDPVDRCSHPDREADRPGGQCQRDIHGPDGDNRYGDDRARHSENHYGIHCRRRRTGVEDHAVRLGDGDRHERRRQRRQLVGAACPGDGVSFPNRHHDRCRREHQRQFPCDLDLYRDRGCRYHGRWGRRRCYRGRAGERRLYRQRQRRCGHGTAGGGDRHRAGQCRLRAAQCLGDRVSVFHRGGRGRSGTDRQRFRQHHRRRQRQ